MSNYEYTEAVESILFELIDPDDDAAIDEIRARLDLGWGLTDIFDVVADYKNGSLGGGGGVTITEALDDSEVEVDTSSSSWLPTPFDIVIDDERMTVTSRVANVLTVTRGVESTVAAAHSDGAVVVTVPVAPVTSVKVFGGSPLTGDVTIPLATTSTNGLLSDTLWDKLDGIEAGATANMTDAEIRDLDDAGWTGTLTAAKLEDEAGTTGPEKKVMLYSERAKLAGIASEATKNQADSVTNDLSRGSWTGTLDANKISDNAGTGSTDGRKYTKADKDKVSNLPSGTPTYVVATDLTAHKDRNDGTREHYASAVDASTASEWGDYDIFGYTVHEDLIDNLNWTAGTSVDAILAQLAEAAAVDNILHNVHIDGETNVHGIVDTARLISYNTNGVIRFVKASTIPPVGTNPPADSIDAWVGAGQDLHFRNSNGDETVVVPGWRNVYTRSTSDAVVTSDATNFTACLTAPENLAIGEYIVKVNLYYLAAANATAGGIKLKWTLPASTSFDWGATGPAFDAGAGTDREALLMTTKHGTAASTLDGFGGQGTSARLPLTIEGSMRITTAGAPVLSFSQSASSATATTVKANSWASFVRVA